MIIVDGCKSDKEISNFANLEEVLTNLMDDEKMDDRVVTDVFVNNESFSEIYPTRPRMCPATPSPWWRCALCPPPNWPWTCRLKWARWPG